MVKMYSTLAQTGALLGAAWPVLGAVAVLGGIAALWRARRNRHSK